MIRRNHCQISGETAFGTAAGVPFSIWVSGPTPESLMTLQIRLNGVKMTLKIRLNGVKMTLKRRENGVDSHLDSVNKHLVGADLCPPCQNKGRIIQA